MAGINPSDHKANSCTWFHHQAMEFAEREFLDRIYKRASPGMTFCLLKAALLSEREALAHCPEDAQPSRQILELSVKALEENVKQAEGNLR